MINLVADNSSATLSQTYELATTTIINFHIQLSSMKLSALEITASAAAITDEFAIVSCFYSSNLKRCSRRVNFACSTASYKKYWNLPLRGKKWADAQTICGCLCYLH